MTQKNKTGLNEAVETKKQMDKSASNKFTTPDGVEVTLSPVGSYVVREAQLKIPKPKVPLAPHPNDPNDPTKSIENPNDPKYLAALDEYDAEMERVSVDAMTVFGIEIDHVPNPEKWLKKLKFMELVSEEELARASEDQEYLEFIYKRYFVATAEVLMRIASMSGLRQEDIQTAVDSFRG